MRDLTIRPARPDDLAPLTQRLGQERFFADRLDRQSNGRGVLLTAWHDGMVIGDVYLWLEPAEEQEIREHLPGTALVTHLEVHGDHRRLGAATRLLLAAEQLLALKGYEEVALVVEVTNRAVSTVYRRLGYQEWPNPSVKCYIPSDLDQHRHVEICNVMIKTLAG